MKRIETQIRTFAPVDGYEGLYSVSKCGKIYLHKRKRTANIKPNKSGYTQIGLRKKGQVKTILVHRIVAKAFIDPIPNKSHVNHIDGNKSNNDVNNLEWCTHTENMHHVLDTGLKDYGEQEDTREQANFGNYGTEISIINIAKFFDVDEGEIMIGRDFKVK